jgi:aldose 1-epimerase
MFTRLSPDGEEGYPGNMQVQAVLTIHNNKLIITLRAISDADTLCNLTMHTYFNLNGGSKDVLDHSLQLDSLRHGLVDANVLCTGQFREVIGTPLDFRMPAPVRQGVDKSDQQVELANGIDHHFVLESDKDQLVLTDPDSGRSVTVSTTFPGMQLYSGNYIGKCEGLDGCTYDANWGLAIEPQYLPDSIHNQQHPDALLKANELFEEKIVYTFDAQ